MILSMIVWEKTRLKFDCFFPFYFFSIQSMYCNRCASNDALQYLSSSRLSRTVRKIKTNQIYQISHYLQFLQLSQYHNILLLPRYILSEFRIAFKIDILFLGLYLAHWIYYFVFRSEFDDFYKIGWNDWQRTSTKRRIKRK